MDAPVIRSEVDGPMPVIGLQWVIQDEMGDEVLGRNAEGEYRCRYYRSGAYPVVLEAFDGTKYVEISNRVAIVCP